MDKCIRHRIWSYRFCIWDDHKVRRLCLEEGGDDVEECAIRGFVNGINCLTGQLDGEEWEEREEGGGQ